jgi:MFS family permease
MTELITTTTASPPAVHAGRTTGRRAAPRTGHRPSHRLALPVLLTGTALIVLDFFIVNVALPSLQTDLHAGSTALEWIVAGYGLTLAVFLITAGRVGDRIGRRRVFSGGVALFTAASAACGLAPNTDVLVVARLFQGVGAAMISPTVLAIIGMLYAGAARARAIGLYATVMGVAAASGQLLGGLLLPAGGPSPGAAARHCSTWRCSGSARSSQGWSPSWRSGAGRRPTSSSSRSTCSSAAVCRRCTRAWCSRSWPAPTWSARWPRPRWPRAPAVPSSRPAR